MLIDFVPRVQIPPATLAVSDGYVERIQYIVFIRIDPVVPVLRIKPLRSELQHDGHAREMVVHILHHFVSETQSVITTRNIRTQVPVQSRFQLPTATLPTNQIQTFHAVQIG